MKRKKLIILFLIALVLINVVFIAVQYYRNNYQCLFQNKRESKVFRIESPAESQDSQNRIPAILHQTWKNAEIPEKWIIPYRQCQEKLTGYQHMLWTDEKARQFIAAEYGWFLQTFDAYPYNIQRADAIRYFALYHFGGFYVDLDIGCARNFDPLRTQQVILPETQPIGFSNDLMASTPKHPFFKSIILNLAEWNINLLTNYPTVMFSAGPMFLDAMYCRWGAKQDITILPTYYYGGSEDSFVSHFGGSSWHSWDAVFVMIAWNNWKQVLFFCIAIAIMFYFYFRCKILQLELITFRLQKQKLRF